MPRATGPRPDHGRMWLPTAFSTQRLAGRNDRIQREFRVKNEIEMSDLLSFVCRARSE